MTAIGLALFLSLQHHCIPKDSSSNLLPKLGLECCIPIPIATVMISLALALFSVVVACCCGLVDADTPLSVIFVNQSPDKTIELYWENHQLNSEHPERRRHEATIAPRGGWHKSRTFLGHEFSYEMDGERHYVTPPPGNVNDEQFIMVAGSTDGYRVRCEVSVNSQQYMDYLDILVKPYWAPRAASRFLELVRNGYYDGVAFNRVVPNFLTQFGIAKDYVTRTREREVSRSSKY